LSKITLHKEENAFFVKLTINEKPFEALVDSGAQMSYLNYQKCVENGLVCRGGRKGLTCIHGTLHMNLEIPVYEGKIELGDFSQDNKIFFSLGDDVSIGLKKIEAIIGRDIMKNFSVNLDWKNCTGELE